MRKLHLQCLVTGFLLTCQSRVAVLSALADSLCKTTGRQAHQPPAYLLAGNDIVDGRVYYTRRRTQSGLSLDCCFVGTPYKRDSPFVARTAWLLMNYLQQNSKKKKKKGQKIMTSKKYIKNNSEKLAKLTFVHVD